MHNENLIIAPWKDYELLDSGNNLKLERFADYILIRPETQALWAPLHPELWDKAQAEFSFHDSKGGWKKYDMPESWEMVWDDVKFSLRLTSFKHTGIFPEQAANWEWLQPRVAALQQPKILNLFGYTGIASLVAAKKGAMVTHLDASKQSNTWARDNSILSGTPEGSIRYITDDAMRFAEREIRRGTIYDGIILDPPAFGRGPEGEVFRIEEHLPSLLDVLSQLLSKKPGSFFLLNGYAAGYAPQSLLQSVEGSFPEMKTLKDAGFGELHLQESNSDRKVASGIYVRFVR
jgi:23S rRNA (cytosine1962-C5)-methyltransferase